MTKPGASAEDLISGQERFTVSSFENGQATLHNQLGEEVHCARTLLPAKTKVGDKLVITVENEAIAKLKRYNLTKALLQELLNESQS